MTVANVSQGDTYGLPPALITAQAAIHLPEVREMLRRLSEYELGIFMPHMHDGNTGEFRSLPDELVQVESGLAVSFRPSGEMAGGTDRFLAVGWCWRAGAPTPTAGCEMVADESGGTGNDVKHKMP